MALISQWKIVVGLGKWIVENLAQSKTEIQVRLKSYKRDHVIVEAVVIRPILMQLRNLEKVRFIYLSAERKTRLY